MVGVLVVLATRGGVWILLGCLYKEHSTREDGWSFALLKLACLLLRGLWRYFLELIKAASSLMPIPEVRNDQY